MDDVKAGSNFVDSDVICPGKLVALRPPDMFDEVARGLEDQDRDISDDESTVSVSVELAWSVFEAVEGHDFPPLVDKDQSCHAKEVLCAAGSGVAVVAGIVPLRVDGHGSARDDLVEFAEAATEMMLPSLVCEWLLDVDTGEPLEMEEGMVAPSDQ